MKLSILFSLMTPLLTLSLLAAAQDAKQAVAAKLAPPEKKTQVLDFNADVIEGELKKPQLFLELGANVKDFNSLLLNREDFNDFQAVDMKKRLRFIEIK